MAATARCIERLSAVCGGLAALAVSINDHGAAYEMTRHLASLGHQRIEAGPEQRRIMDGQLRRLAPEGQCAKHTERDDIGRVLPSRRGVEQAEDALGAVRYSIGANQAGEGVEDVIDSDGARAILSANRVDVHFWHVRFE